MNDAFISMPQPLADPRHIEEIKGGIRSLPTLPAIALPLLRACQQPNGSLDHVHNLLRYDAGLLVRLLDMQAHLGQQPHQDINQLLANTDSDTIKRLVLVGLSERHPHWQPPHSDLNRFLKEQWVHSLQMAYLARSFALQIGFPRPNQAYFAALLHNIGQLVLQAADSDDYLTLWRQHTDTEHLLALEQQHYGTHHAAIGAELMKAWHLEPSMQDAVRHHHADIESLRDAHPLTRLVYHAHAIAWHRFDSFKDVALFTRRLFTIKTDHVAPIVESAMAQTAEVIRALSITLPRGLIRQRLVPLWDSEPDQDDSQDAFLFSQLEREARQTEQLDSFRASLSQCESELAIQHVTEQAVYALFGAREVMFFQRQADDDCLQGNCLLRRQACLNDMRIGISASHSLLAKAANTGTSTFWLPESSPLSIADQEILNQLTGEGFVCVPQQSGDTVRGVLVLGIDNDSRLRLPGHHAALGAFAAAVDHRLIQLAWHQQQCDDIRTTERGLYANQLKRLIHEVNNPLSIAQNHIHVLALQSQGQPEQHEHCVIVEEEIIRGADLLKAHADQLEQPDEQSAFSLNELISDCMLVFQSAFLDERQIEPELDLDPGLPPVYLDSNAIKQILANLVRNAAESLEAGGWLCVHTQDQIIIDGQAYCEIRIEDDGPGVPNELLDKLFLPVQSTKGSSNAGIGLSIVKDMVNRMGGSISYRRSADLHTVFSVQLPRQCTPLRPAQPE